VSEPRPTPADYADRLTGLKERIRSARQRALLAANEEQIRLYHEIGREILERQGRQGWGAKVIDRLSADLRDAFPDMKGFSSRNLASMKAFAQECPDLRIGQQSAARLPWFHIVTVITKVSDPALRDWYARAALEQSWPRDTLVVQIRNQLHLRQGRPSRTSTGGSRPPRPGSPPRSSRTPTTSTSSGSATRPRNATSRTRSSATSPGSCWNWGRASPSWAASSGWRSVGMRFSIGLLFDHTRLKCYVMVELKAQAFKPEHAGQLNFDLAAVDAQIKADDDRPTIGLLLCRTQNRLVAEYALSGIDKPIGVAEYQLVRALPQPLDASLPSIEEIEAELSRDLDGREPGSDV